MVRPCVRVGQQRIPVSCRLDSVSQSHGLLPLRVSKTAAPLTRAVVHALTRDA